MAPVVVWIIVALVSAVVVLVVAGAASGRTGGGREVLADLRSGLRRDHRRGMLRGVREEMAEVAEAEGGSVEDIFAIGEPDERDYVQAQDLVQTLGRATGRSSSRARASQLSHR
ncbi:hypothetical protein ICW40_19385 [Actinotalea ferrariae]|uniref:hypothetical protein n=1 Tax=Actinotalea ferrariae TaxID=1386098 RepID=UPI001C8C3FE9|nr:hypothetical protein [Actinotalea ferrariae]MBX9246958.1 hypothetical protein [Actinotalea ferrariae]